MNVYHSFTRQSWNGDCSVAVLSHRVNLLTRGAYLGNNRVSVSSIRTSLLAAIDVDLVYFSELFVSWNAMENIIKAVHVCDWACYTNACLVLTETRPAQWVTLHNI